MLCWLPILCPRPAAWLDVLESVDEVVYKRALTQQAIAYELIPSVVLNRIGIRRDLCKIPTQTYSTLDAVLDCVEDFRTRLNVGITISCILEARGEIMNVSNAVVACQKDFKLQLKWKQLLRNQLNVHSRGSPTFDLSGLPGGRAAEFLFQALGWRVAEDKLQDFSSSFVAMARFPRA
eukprot:5053654-Amphidinium_carterae.1